MPCPSCAEQRVRMKRYINQKLEHIARFAGRLEAPAPQGQVLTALLNVVRVTGLEIIPGGGPFAVEHGNGIDAIAIIAESHVAVKAYPDLRAHAIVDSCRKIDVKACLRELEGALPGEWKEG